MTALAAGLVEGDLYIDDAGQTVLVDRSGPPNPSFEQVIYVTAGPQESSARTPVLIATAVAAVIALALVVQRSRRSRPRAG